MYSVLENEHFRESQTSKMDMVFHMVPEDALILTPSNRSDDVDASTVNFNAIAEPGRAAVGLLLCGSTSMVCRVDKSLSPYFLFLNCHQILWSWLPVEV